VCHHCYTGSSERSDWQLPAHYTSLRRYPARYCFDHLCTSICNGVSFFLILFATMQQRCNVTRNGCSYRYETFSICRQWFWDHAVEFAMGCGTRIATHVTTCSTSTLWFTMIASRCDPDISSLRVEKPITIS